MKVFRNQVRWLGRRPFLLIYPDGSPKPFWVDKCFIKKLGRVRWRYDAKRQRARGFFGRGRTRQYLHRYVLTLAGKLYPEVTFANGDPFDCRIVNLKPYRADEDGATRCRFKNATTKHKGVCYHKRAKKWVAMIRVRTRLVHLGYYPDADAAARAYAAAFKLAHPNLRIVT